MGLEAKAKYVLGFAKEMILNDSFQMTPDIEAVVFGPLSSPEAASPMQYALSVGRPVFVYGRQIPGATGE